VVSAARRRRSPTRLHPDTLRRHPVLNAVLVAPSTRTLRNIPTQVNLDVDEGMPYPCALSFDNVLTVALQ